MQRLPGVKSCLYFNNETSKVAKKFVFYRKNSQAREFDADCLFSDPKYRKLWILRIGLRRKQVWQLWEAFFTIYQHQNVATLASPTLISSSHSRKTHKIIPFVAWARSERVKMILSTPSFRAKATNNDKHSPFCPWHGTPDSFSFPRHL